jgi:hypothetical protein
VESFVAREYSSQPLGLESSQTFGSATEQNPLVRYREEVGQEARAPEIAMVAIDLQRNVVYQIGTKFHHICYHSSVHNQTRYFHVIHTRSRFKGAPIRKGTRSTTLVLDPGVFMSIGWFKIHSEWHLREGDQLDVSLPVLAQDGDVVVQPQPFVLDVESEGSTDDLEVELEGDTVFEASGCTADLELGKEGKFCVNADGDGFLGKVDDDDDLPKVAVSSAARKKRRKVLSVTLMVRGPRWKDTS